MNSSPVVREVLTQTTSKQKRKKEGNKEKKNNKEKKGRNWGVGGEDLSEDPSLSEQLMRCLIGTSSLILS